MMIPMQTDQRGSALLIQIRIGKPPRVDPIMQQMIDQHRAGW